MSSPPHSLDRHAREDAKGLVRRIALGISSQFVVILSLVLRSILVVPFFLQTHGIDGYADWVKLLALAQFSIIFSLGQNIHYSYQLRTCRAERDHVGMNRALAHANGFFLWLYILVVVGFTLALAVVDVGAILNLAVMSRTEANLVLILLTASMLGEAYRDTLRGVYTAYGELTRGEAMFASANIFLGVLLIGALVLDAGMPLLAVLYVVVVPGIICGAALVDFRRYTELRVGISLGWPTLTRERRRHLFAHTVPQITERILFNGPMMVLGVFNVASDVVAQFNLVRTATGLLRARSVAMVFAVEMTRQRTQEDWAAFRRLHRRGAVVMGIYGGGLAGGTLAIWDLFLPFWTNGAMSADMMLLGLMIAETALIAFGEHSTGLLRFGGRIADVARCQSVAALFFLVCAVPALAIGGVYTMMAVTVLGAGLFLYLLPTWFAARNMRAPAPAALLLPSLCGGATAAATYGGLTLLRALVGI